MNRFSIEDRKIIAGVDLGTSHVTCVIGFLSKSGIELVGVAQVPHKGIYKGRIVNMKETSEAIQHVCKESEVMANLQVSQLFLGIGGDYHVFFSQGMSVISSQQVTIEDVNRAVETAKAVSLPTGHRLLHVLPKNFTVDQEGPFFNPLALSGLRLETDVLMISIPDASVQNVLQCLRYAGYSARGLVFQPLANTLSILSEDEKQSGVCMLDIGQDQTYFTVVAGLRIKHIGSLFMGGEDFTHDLMTKLRIPRDLAEQIKIKYGHLVFQKEWDDKDDLIEECHDWNIKVTLKEVNEVLLTRAETLFQEVHHQLQSLQYLDELEGGLVLTGKGSYLKGLDEVGRSIMERSVKVGSIVESLGITDIENRKDYATAVGILSYVQNEKLLDYRVDHLEGKVFKIKRWMQELFP